MAAGRNGGKGYPTSAEGNPTPGKEWSYSATRHRTPRKDSSTQQATERTADIESKEMDVVLYRVINALYEIYMAIYMKYNDALVVRRTKEGCRQRWRLRVLKMIGSRENCNV